MAIPRRHHYLPVFLLKRFRLVGRDRVPQVRVLRADRVIETAVHNIGVERDFHNATAFFPDPERLLSGAEADFAAELTRWTPGLLDRKGQIAADRLIPHLRLRSKIMRRIGSQLMEIAVASTDEAITAAVAAGRPLRTIQQELSALAAEVAAQGKSDGWNDAAVLRADERARDIVSRHLAHWAVLDTAQFCRYLLRDGFPADLVNGTHTTLILTALLNHRKQAAFGDCRWALLRVPGPLLLGDVGPLGLYVDHRRLKPMYMSSAPLRAIYLPIGPHQLLAGWYGRRPAPPSARALNAATVALSHEFAVGPLSRSTMNDLRPRLGTRAKEDSAEAILGVSTPSGAAAVYEIASHLSGLIAQRIALYWSGTPAESRGLVPSPLLPSVFE